MSGFSGWEELKQIFGSDFKFAQTFIILDYLSTLLYLILSLMYCSWFIDSNLFFLVVLLFPMIFSGISYYSDRKISLNKRIKGSRYEKTVKKPIGLLFAVVIIFIFVIGFLKGFNELETKTIQEAIRNFGYHVKAPTYIPFNPTKEYGWIDKKINQLQISYQNGFSSELVIYVTPRKPRYFYKKGEKVLLYGNTTGYFSVGSGDCTLKWERRGLYYSLDYGAQNTPTKKEIMKIVQSME